VARIRPCEGRLDLSTALSALPAMICCLNPNCKKPENSDGASVCQSCGSPLKLLRARYKAVQPLGQGGFGRTYLALDEDRLNARCVIKQFAPQVQSEKSKEKAINLFKQEAERLDQLGEHAQIPTLLAYFEQDGYLYLVQQFIEGLSLLQQMRQHGALSERQIRDLLADALPVLRFIHKSQVIHRDITPANMLRRQADDRLVLIDFGVAKQVNADSAAEQPGTRIGTEGYSPMEQFRGGKAYPASDLYSLGATCIHLMTQTRPDNLYDPLNGRWLWREHLADKGVPVSDQLAYILDNLLKDLVADRYQSADEVMRDLNADSFMPPTRATATVGAAVRVKEPIPQPMVRQASPQVAQQVAQPMAQQVAARSPMPSAPVRNPSGQPSGNPSGSPALKNPSQPTSQPTSGNAASSKPPLSVVPNSKVTSIQPNRTPIDHPNCVKTLMGHASWITCVAVSPNSPVVASSSLDDSIRVWNLNTGETLLTLTGHNRGVNTIAISPDGKTLVSGSDDYSIKIWNLQTGALLGTLTGHQRDVNAVVISPDGKFLCSGGEDRTIRLWHMGTGSLLKTLAGVAGMIKSVAISPDGKTMASGGLDNKTKLWSLQTGEQLQTLIGHLNCVNAIAFSPDGNSIATGSKDKTIRIWNRWSGELTRTLSDHTRDVNALAITPNSKLLVSASSDNTLKLWNLATGNLIDTWMGHSDTINAIAIHPDGKTLVSGSSDKSLKIWQLPN
jgi:WD40 repeat protein/tRNA A-37 threonylcarbamoyl transferase component Bud32